MGDIVLDWMQCNRPRVSQGVGPFILCMVSIWSRGRIYRRIEVGVADEW